MRYEKMQETVRKIQKTGCENTDNSAGGNPIYSYYVSPLSLFHLLMCSWIVRSFQLD